jgi:hypothetical protein
MKWSVSRHDVPQKVKQQIGPKIFTLTVICGIDGLHVVDGMTEQHSYNTPYFLSHILEPLLLAVFPDGRKPHSCQLSLHLDNWSVHRSRVSKNFFAENSIVRVPHPSYIPDLGPFGFWLFGHIKTALAGQQFPGLEDLLIGIQKFLSEIQRSELEVVFHHWIELVQWVFDSDGDYFLE